MLCNTLTTDFLLLTTTVTNDRDGTWHPQNRNFQQCKSLTPKSLISGHELVGHMPTSRLSSWVFSTLLSPPKNGPLKGSFLAWTGHHPIGSLHITANHRPVWNHQSTRSSLRPARYKYWVTCLDLSSERAPQIRQDCNFKKKIISLVRSPKLGSTPRHTDWLTVSCKVTLTLTDWLRISIRSFTDSWSKTWKE
jgi:hypothetical protein